MAGITQNYLYLTGFIIILIIAICLGVNYFVKKVVKDELKKYKYRKQLAKKRHNRIEQNEYNKENTKDDEDSYVDPMDVINDE